MTHKHARRLLWFACLVALPCWGQRVIKLAPKGEALLAAKAAELPPFDLQAARDEAEGLYPIIKPGDLVSVIRRNREVKGAFRGMDAKFLRIGETNVALIDLDPETIAKFKPEGVQKQRDQYLARVRAIDQLRRDDLLAEFRAEVASKYPPFPEHLLKTLFENLPELQRESNQNEFLGCYNARLPMLIDGREFLRTTIAAFLASHPELVGDGDRFGDRQQVEARQRRQAEIVTAGNERRQERILRPRTAAPVIVPDGGAFQPGIKLEIVSATPAAEIHYTLDGSDPDEDSPRYTEPFALARMVVVKAIAYHPEFNDSDLVVTAPWIGGRSGRTSSK